MMGPLEEGPLNQMGYLKWKRRRGGLEGTEADKLNTS